MEEINYSFIEINSPDQFKLLRQIVQIVQINSKSTLGLKRTEVIIELDKLDKIYDGETSLDKAFGILEKSGLVCRPKHGYWNYTALGVEVSKIESYEMFTKLKNDSEKDNKRISLREYIKEEIRPIRMSEENKLILINYLMNYGTNVFNVINKLRQINNRILEFYDLADSDIPIYQVGLKDIIGYVNNYAGYDHEIEFYPNVSGLLSICQNVAITKFKIILPNNRILLSNFHTMDEGAKGSGKSYTKEDLIIGKEDSNIPPVGLSLIKTLSPSINAPAFVETLWLHSLFDCHWVFICSEISGWLKNKQMLNQLKRALNNEYMEWELKVKSSIPPFIVNGSFNLACNSSFRKDTGLINGDADLEAVKDRCITRGWQYTPLELRHIKKQNNKICFDMEKATTIRTFLSKTYNKLSSQDYSVIINQKQIDQLQDVIDRFVDYLRSFTKNEYFDLKFSSRILNNTIKYVGCLTVIDKIQKINNKIMMPDEYIIKLGQNLLFTMLKDLQPALLDSDLHKINEYANANILTSNIMNKFQQIPKGIKLDEYVKSCIG